MIRQLLSRVSAALSSEQQAKDQSIPAAGCQGIELTPDLILLALTSPVQANRIAQEMARTRYGPSVELGKDVRITCPLDQLLQIPNEALWSQGPRAIIRDSMEELIQASKSLTHEEIFNRHYGPVDPGSYNMAAYMRCTRLRILRLYEALLRRGLANATILEVGSLYGCFAFILRRLGFQVTAIDRYNSYGHGFRELTDLMEGAGVTVIRTTRENEEDVVAELGEYDGCIAMAVVEHVPHTPRMFLEQLRQHVRTGGVIALDTPNLTRYWNRIKLKNGESVFMDIKSQYYADLPYEGHHREYTSAELCWMLEQLGCKEIESEHFDYNLVQFDVIDRPHIECLLRIIEDPSYADTILVSGRIGNTRSGC